MGLTAGESQSALLALAASLVTGLGTWYATRARVTEMKSTEGRDLLRMLMEERTSRETEMRALRADIQSLREQNERLAVERIQFAEAQQVVRHDLKAMLRAANVKLDDQRAEIADLRLRIAQLEALQ